MLFILKKIVAAFLVPPGLFITLLLAAGILLWRRKARRTALFLLALALVIWGLSAPPVSDLLTRGLETGLPEPRLTEADIVVVLSGYGERMGPAIQLQKRLGVPILFSGYISLKHSAVDRENFTMALERLGVPRDMVILETDSRDTLENLRQARDICRRRGFRRPLIVSSAFHGKRILLSLKKLGFPAEFYPADFDVVGRTIRYSWRSALPEAQALLGCSTAISEYLGLLFYRIFY